MPRQPYLPNFQHLNYSVGALVLKDRPELCAAIGRCIAIWSHVDNDMGMIFASMVGIESDVALEVFLSLRRSNNQREALNTAAKFKLKADDFSAFQATLSVYSSLEAQRNSLAHGCFGTSPDDPTVLFWIDVKDNVHFIAEVISKESRGEIAEDRHSRLKQNMFVYRLSDLDSLYSEMEEFWWV